jgi:tetratricopeptide (TPR) repeat protein
MRAVFDHSWRLLSTREREILARLSVFRGGFTREAGQDVAGASLRDLMSLVNRSLLHRAPTGRYEIHELLRQYATEKLKESPTTWETTHDRHSGFYIAALRGWGADLKGPRQMAALVEMDSESENVRAAWDWAAARGQAERLDRAVFGLCTFYLKRLRNQEGEAACRTAAENLAATASGDGLRVWAKLLAYQSMFPVRGPARKLLRQSLDLLERPELADQDTRWERAFVFYRLASVERFSNQDEAKRLNEKSLVLCEALGDRWWMAHVLSSLSSVAKAQGAYGESKTLRENALAIFQALGDQGGVGHALWQLGSNALHQGQLEEGEKWTQESLDLAQETGMPAQIARRLQLLGAAVMCLGKYAKAQSLLEQSVVFCSELGYLRGLATSKRDLGLAKMHLGQYKQARCLGLRALSLAQEISDLRQLGYCSQSLGSVALAEGTYANAQGLLEEGVAALRKVGEQNDLSLTLALLACAERGLGQTPQARQYLYQTLRIGSAIQAWQPRLYGLLVQSLLLADRGEIERAVELYALASRYGHVSSSRWFEDVAGKHIAAVAAGLPSDLVAAAQERGRARDLEATVRELLVELEQEGNSQQNG